MIVASGGSLVVPAIPDLVWGTVSFVIVAVAVKVLAWPTFMRVLDERTRKIEDGLSAAAQAEEKIAHERQLLADQVDDAQREAAQIREKAQANAALIIEEAKKNAAIEAARVTSGAQRQIEADTQVAKSLLRQEIGTLATELAGRIVNQQALDSEVSSRVIESFLDELEEETTSVAAVGEKN